MFSGFFTFAWPSKFWLGALAVAAALGIAYWAMKKTQEKGHFYEIGCDTPVVVMLVGQSQTISAYLLHKPRGTADFNTENGSLEFFRVGDCYSFPTPAPPGFYSSMPNPPPPPPNVTQSTSINPQDSFLPVDNVHSPGSLYSSKLTLTGEQPGTGELQINGDMTSGITYKELSIPVTVYANDGGTSIIDIINGACGQAGDIWSHGLFGNFNANFFKGQNKGLCDHWADWCARMINELNTGEICKIEICWFGAGIWNIVDHVSVRITMCESGDVYYVDGHQDPDSPIFKKDYYETHTFGDLPFLPPRRGTPTSTKTVFPP